MARGSSYSRGPGRRRPARNRVLLCPPGQGTGARPGRRAVGVLHRPGAHRNPMTTQLPWPTPPGERAGRVPESAEWLRLARLARLLSWLTLVWMGVEGGVAIGAAIVAGSAALLGFGLDSGIASVIVIWRFTGTRLASATSERRAQQLVAVSFFLLAPYIAVEAIRALAGSDHGETSIVGLVLTAGTAIFEPALGIA